MYIVISKWQFDPSRADEMIEIEKKMNPIIGGWDGVEFVYSVKTGPDSVTAVIGYKDEETYKRLIQDPDGPFEAVAREHGIEEIGTWLWSERGYTIES